MNSMLRKIASSLSLLILGSLSLNAVATEYHFGINAEVSYKESEAEVRQRYSAFLEELGKATGHKFVFSPVYSDRVAQALKTEKFDFLLIHTHLALRAEKTQGYQMVGFSDDRKNNTVFFFVRPDSPIQTLADIAEDKLGSPGLQSWATATARATLRAAKPDQDPVFVTTRYQETVPLMVELKTAPVGITRSKKLVDEHVGQKKLRVVHTTPALPLNALIAAPKIPQAVIIEVREALGAMTRSKVFEPLGLKGLRYSAEENQRMHDFYLCARGCG